MIRSRKEQQAVTEPLEREAQSPSKDDYRPPGNRGFFIPLQSKASFNDYFAPAQSKPMPAVCSSFVPWILTQFWESSTPGQVPCRLDPKLRATDCAILTEAHRCAEYSRHACGGRHPASQATGLQAMSMYSALRASLRMLNRLPADFIRPKTCRNDGIWKSTWIQSHWIIEPI